MYWPRFNKQGAIADMLGGFGAHISLYTYGYATTGKEITPGGLNPILFGCVASLVLAVVVTLLTSPPPERLVRTFFYREE
jgi:Na+(H+)/acetate symporter ActP